VISLWTDHLAEHAAAIRELVGPDARVAFAQVKYPERELRALQEELAKDLEAPWLADIPAVFFGLGVDIIASQVVFEVSSANPDAVAIIEAHFGLGDRLRAESDGTGAALVPWGTVRGRLTPFEGLDPGSLILRWTGTDPGDCGGGDIGFGVAHDWTFELPCQAGERTIIVAGEGDNEEGWVELGHATVTVREDETTRVRIRARLP
jgi:hypothetical protein